MTPPTIRHRLRLTALALAASAAMLVPTAAPATAATPTFVRTIGTLGQSEMYPSGLDVDSAGNVVVADTGNDRVSFYPAGSTSASWVVGKRGNAVGASPTGFQNPRDVAVDANRVYVADSDNNVVQVLDKSTGAYITKINYAMVTPIGVSVGNAANGDKLILVSNGGNGKVYVFDASLSFVRALNPVTTNSGTRDAATDSDGNVYVADYRGDQIVKYSPTGAVLDTFGGGASAPTCQQITRPYGVDVDDQDHVYVASSTVGTIKEFTANGACEATFGVRGTGANQLLQLRRVAVGSGSSPLVYGADLWGVKILIYQQDGSLAATKLGTGTYPAAGGLNEPHGIAVSGGAVYVTDTVNQRIQRFDLNGSNPIMWGNKGVSEETASFNWAQGIGFNPQSGNVWVANTRNNRLDEFGPNGGASALRQVGRRVGGSPNFYWPMDVVFTSGGTMYVADTFNNRIQAFSVTSTSVTHLWTTGTLGSGTGNFSRPFALAYDGSTATPRILVTDTRNSRIVALNANTGGWQGVLPIAKGTALGKIRSPRGIDVTAGGQIWLSDTGNDRIQAFNGDGSFANIAVGSKGSGANEFNFPQRLKIAGGLVYVADTFNSRIQVYQA
jgi:sugar lactone lactonase YvrE